MFSAPSGASASSLLLPKSSATHQYGWRTNRTHRRRWAKPANVLLWFTLIVLCWPLLSAILATRGESRLHAQNAGQPKGRLLKARADTHNAQRALQIPAVPSKSPPQKSTMNPQGYEQALPKTGSSGPDTGKEPTEPFLTSEFPPYESYAALVEKAATLPEVVHLPFSVAVKDMVLPPWATQWIAEGRYDPGIWGNLSEPRIDIAYTWVNGSEESFRNTKRWYEENSTLNDPAGEWLASHGENRYRDWDELRYSIRSVEKFADFRNEIFVISNAIRDNTTRKLQRMKPAWLNTSPATKERFHVLVQEDYFAEEMKGCIPAFNSLTVENQMYNLPSKDGIDPIFALSDDMILGKPHAAADIWSPLYGSMMGFKTNGYSSVTRPTDADAKRFGEKPWLIYTSYLLNRRFGVRKRKGQAHFGHSITRSIAREAMQSFPGPELQSACSRFRGDFRFQLYLWFGTFHYLIERHREALLWSYIMVRSDSNSDGNLEWEERQRIIDDLAEGMANEGPNNQRFRHYYHLLDTLEDAGLQAPKVNTEILWTSSDGPVHIRDLECSEFDLDECLAPGFSAQDFGDSTTRNPVFSAAVIFDRVAHQNVHCGDCLIKLLLNRAERGFEPMLPNAMTHPKERETAIKALLRYQYSVMNPDALFVMVTDAEQVETTLLKRLVRKNKVPGQLCLNDDVTLDDEGQLRDLQAVLSTMYKELFPTPSPYEKV